MTVAKNPTRDPVQIFCGNFPSHKDLTACPSKNKAGVVWEKFDDDIQLRISRYSLEVLNLVTSAKDNTNALKHLAEAILELYGPSPVEKFCRPELIAKALIETNLFEGNLDDVTREVSTSVTRWLERAVAESRKLIPELADFEGKAGYTLMGGSLRWAPIVWSSEYLESHLAAVPSRRVANAKV